MTCGISTGYLSLVIMALYIDSERVQDLYLFPGLLWFTIPILFYWLTRMWLMTHRGEMTSDPVVFTLRDRRSYIMFILMIIVVVAARLVNDEPFHDLLFLR